MMLKFGMAGLAALLMAGTAQAADSPSDIVARHMAAVNKGDLAAVMADYADDAIVLQSGTALQGKAAIQGFFARMTASRANGGGTPLVTTKLWQEGEVGFVNWASGPVSGTDEFVVRNGKIVAQVVFITARPAPPPQ